MNIQSFDAQIVIDIPDSAVGGTILKRKAALKSFTYDLSNKTLTTSWIVSYFANDNGAYGEAINFLPNYTKDLVADNSVVIDSSNFHVLTPDERASTDFDTDTNLWYEFDFYQMIAATQTTNVHQLLTQAGQTAATQNRF